jgi:chemotaxis protein methyltransferase CheR
VSKLALSAADFSFVAMLVNDRSAVVLEPGKEYLVQSRLSPLVPKHGCENLAELIERLRKHPNEVLVREVVEAMVTTETTFFRDIHPFDVIRRTLIPQLVERRQSSRSLNIWCAACSSGQEPYSLAILLKESFPQLAGWRLNLWATDISEQMLERSRAGRYSQLEVNRGLSAAYLLKYFRQEGTDWILQDAVRNMVTFSRLNLTGPWPAMPKWDIILLRNVMIYFNDATKRSILERVDRSLATDGFLLLGGAETTINLVNSFERVESLKSGFYRHRIPAGGLSRPVPEATT